MQARLQKFLPIGKPFDILGCNLYVVHQRVAGKFRVGRAILAGDAAHVNSPIGAMGMNSGIHDAINLADKLIAIARKEADDSVLDRYERQRRHVAVAHTQAQTIRNKRLLAEQDPRCAGEITMNCGGPPRTPSWRANFCCAARCSKASAKPKPLLSGGTVAACRRLTVAASRMMLG